MSTTAQDAPRLLAHRLGGGGPDLATLIDLEFSDGCERSLIATSHGVDAGRRVSNVLVRLWLAGSIDPEGIDDRDILRPAEGHACLAWIARELRYMAVTLTDDGYRTLRISPRSEERVDLFDLRRSGAGLERQLCARDADCNGEEHRWILVSADCLPAALIWHLDLERGVVVPPTPLLVDRA